MCLCDSSLRMRNAEHQMAQSAILTQKKKKPDCDFQKMATALLVSVPAPAAHAGIYKLNYIYI